MVMTHEFMDKMAELDNAAVDGIYAIPGDRNLFKGVDFRMIVKRIDELGRPLTYEEIMDVKRKYPV